MNQSAIHKLNPEISVQNQQVQYKKVQTQVSTMKNRVQLLRMQLQKQKQTIKKNKQLTKQAIQKKIQVNKINQYKIKDDSSQISKIQQLRQRNKSFRQNHAKQIQNIQKAIYLVKLDDARQLKNISITHKKKIQQMDRQFLSQQKQKKQKITEQSTKAKQRYMQYWKEKIGSLYLQQAQSVMELSKKKEQKKKQMDKLQQQEMKLLQQINKYHSQQVESKKQYLAALSLPVKQVAQAMRHSPDKRSKMRSSIEMSNQGQSQISQLPNSSTIVSDTYSYRSPKSGIKMPNTSVNQAKLKIILKQLKKMQKSQINKNNTSR